MTTSAKNPIAQAPSCQDDFDRQALSCEEALKRILNDVAPVDGLERLHIKAALGRIMGEDVQARINVPPHTNSAMDGYALRSQDLPVEGETSLGVAGTAWAGRPFCGNLNPGECVRIFTGAPMPKGTETVIIQEQVQRDGDTIRLAGSFTAGQNVRAAGEDIALGQTVLSAGRRLTPADLGLLASVGVGEVSVRRRPRVAYFSTGDELRSVGETLSEGAIYDSNRYVLHGVLSRLGVEILDLGVVRDTPEAIHAAMGQAARIADAVISSGGVSVGEADHVTDALCALGRVAFWKVAMKPGRPLAFGRVGGAVFFGLPGNPVSVMVTFYQFVQPALRRMMGESDFSPLTIKVRCASKLKKRPGRVEFQRGRLVRDEQGDLQVYSTGSQGSAILSSMSQANCFIVLALESGQVAPGAMVGVQPFSDLV
ncbi:MAG: molybdopterin molybdotransferase MoeA [Gammaproteobacteria bacterium]